jgi:hypothetical protein
MPKKNALETVIQDLATKFAAGVVQALRGASLQEILAEARPVPTEPTPTQKSGPSRRPRGREDARSDSSQSAIGAALRGHDDGLRAEQLRAALRMSKPAFTRAVREALRVGSVRKTGEKRGTTYFAR